MHLRQLLITKANNYPGLWIAQWGTLIAQSVVHLASDCLDTSVPQVSIPLKMLAKISISVEIVPVMVCINGLTVTFCIAVAS